MASTALPLSYRHIGNVDPITTTAQASMIQTAKEKSSRAAPRSTFWTRQRDPQRHKAIPCGRPYRYEETIPTTLLHPVFGQFVDDCRKIEVTAEDNRFVERLATAMSALYDSEAERIQAVEMQFQSYHIHFTINETQTTGYLADRDNRHRYVIAEFACITGNFDLYLQAVEDYLESTRESAVKFVRSPLPCLLLAIYGPHLVVFAGAAWNKRPTAQLLLSPISFQYHPTDTHFGITAARHMAAFRKASQTLKEYYENLQETPTSTPALPHLFPHPTSYRSLQDKTLKHFQYVRELDPDQLVFLGTEHEGDRICVKFVPRYSPDAHEFLASLGCAPALRGFEAVGNGWFMVVMDMLPGEFETIYDCRERLPSSVLANISEKLGLFHDAGFVHCDIRDVNIMVPKSDRTQFTIIDFDWAGRAGEVRYPPFVNRTNIVRPPGACDGEVILADHDIYMLERVARFNFKA
ncbi:hypothetical protein EDC04DRAFT_3115486 [Pisolithus marmoratus]|nr:hypothetical protein EDC04DRAFT_3115486 [Pisolithus marmoratus]